MFLEIMAGISTLYSMSQSKKAGDLAEQGLADQRRAGDASLQFRYEQYDRWKSIYGDIEENLGDFYQGLTPDYIESQGLQELEKSYSQMMPQVKERFAQMGVPTGAQADIEARIELEKAEQKATVRAEAPYKAAELKQNFLKIGTGQGAEPMGQALERQAGRAGQQALGLSQMAGAEAEAGFGAVSQFANLLGKKYGAQQPAASTEEIS